MICAERNRGPHFAISEVGTSWPTRLEGLPPARDLLDRCDAFEAPPSDPTHLHKYLYAGSDAINNTDPAGSDFSLTSMLANIAIGIVLGAVDGYLQQANRQENQDLSWGQIGINAGIGGVFGAGGYALHAAGSVYRVARYIELAALGVGVGLGAYGTYDAWDKENPGLAAFRGTITLIGGAVLTVQAVKGFMTWAPSSAAPAVIQGLYGEIERAEIVRLLASVGSRTRLYTRLSGPPDANFMGLHTATDKALCDALPNSAATRYFTADIPTALLDALEYAGLVERFTCSMGTATGVEVVFNKQVLEYIVPLFTELL